MLEIEKLKLKVVSTIKRHSIDNDDLAKGVHEMAIMFAVSHVLNEMRNGSSAFDTINKLINEIQQKMPDGRQGIKFRN